VAQFAALFDLVLRSLILAAALAAGLVALTHWAVRSRHLEPFGGWARMVRRLSDPLLLPIERRLVRLGRSPQEAPFWLFGVVLIGLFLGALESLTSFYLGSGWREAPGLVLLILALAVRPNGVFGKASIRKV